MEGIVPTLDYANGYGRGNSCDDSFWGIILMACLFGGFGGRGHGDDCIRDATDNAELNARFNGIENRIDNIGNREDLARNLEATCMTQRDILEAKYDLGSKTDNALFQTSIGQKDIIMQNMECCCQTQRAIDSVKYEAEKNTCQILNAVQFEGQKTRDYLQCQALEAEKEKNLRLELKVNSLCERDFYRPPAMPAYPSVPNQLPVNPAIYGGCAGGIGFGGYGYTGCC